MEIRLTHIEVGELVKGYFDKQEEGVYGYDNKLNIRPPYQREFVYNEKQRKLVIDTILKGFPLNTMYWVDNGGEKYELLDGQQRTMSICQFVHGEFSIKYNGVEMYYYNLPFEIRRKILDYKLMIYICQGETSERLDWFRTINISGEKLTDQELLNINFIGSWLSDAKIKFSKTNCVAYKLGQKYVKGSPIRQEYLEVVLDWISEGDIVGYMSKHQNDVNANELWLYFNSVIEWVKTTFGEKNYRSEMKGLNWGKLYNLYHTNTYDIEHIEKRVNELMSNDEVTEKKGVYEYILSGEDENLAHKLSKRLFSNTDKRTAYERQKGICPITKEHLPFEEMEADHIIPFILGGKTNLDNLQMISKKINKTKGDKILKI